MVATITERVDDIFNAPSSSVLVHACNCRGAWGAGVAKEFKKRFPAAFNIYRDYCKSKAPEDIVGTALLIQGPTHWIACLFTSRDFGKRVDPVDLILAQTEQSVKDLRRQIEDLKKTDPRQLGPIWSVRINVGYFKVPWSRTLEVLKGCELDMTAVRREEDEVDLEEGQIAGKVDQWKKSKSASSFEGPKSSEYRKSTTSAKSTEAQANESKKLSEPKPTELNDSSQPTKTPRKPPAKKANKPKPKAQAPPKGIPKTDRVLRKPKPKPKVAKVNEEPAPKKVVKKPTKASLKTTTTEPLTKATTKTTTKTTTNATTTKTAAKDKAPPTKKVAAKPKEKKVLADAVARPSPDTASDQSASRNQRAQGREKRKRNEATPTPAAKRTKK